MPISVRNDSGVAVVVLTGEYALDAVYDAVDEAFALFPTTPAAGLVFDLAASQSVRRRSTTQIQMIAEFLALQGERFGYRIAAVVEPEIGRRLRREGEAFAAMRGVTGEFFATYSEAIGWLRGAKRPALRLAASPSYRMRAL